VDQTWQSPWNIHVDDLIHATQQRNATPAPFNTISIADVAKD
jgi:hypothetical protein